jgi:hypothetical protein
MALSAREYAQNASRTEAVNFSSFAPGKLLFVKKPAWYVLGSPPWLQFRQERSRRFFSWCLRDQIRRGTAVAVPKSRRCVSVRRKHHPRHSDCRRGRRLGRHDHRIIWTRPQSPAWMYEKTYARIPETLELREIR